ncbi:polysaccharide deacetylase family protein [Mycobacterium sp. ITM-2016-00317]|uniref:polysaccharide deacetylase family protein n=1 Tax=Mycobacterium sp. ITM-2016-00317 TaxID=2099694 RepID=UPI00287F8BF2|nr:polysaccharide deacetylase family protein [Mycobacterium sp. ITM-2016-00317]WNG90423.1 polysaccharide deacetylase family protein [Mycobacterium sp. ITM-2016-00317]
MLAAAPPAVADAVDCARVKCVALTFDDGPGPFTDRLLQILRDNDARATFFLIGDKVAADPAAARRIAEAGMEIGNHTWQHRDMTTLPPAEVADQFSRATAALQAATGQTPTLARTGFGAVDDVVLAEARRQGLAVINWDVVPLDWQHDADTAATRAILMSHVRPGSVVLLHDTFASTVDLMAEFIPVLSANGYHLVTVSQLLGPRTPGSLYGGRDNGPPAYALAEPTR